MLYEVYDEALSRAEELRAKAFKEWVRKEDVLKKWRSYRAKAEDSIELKVCGVDGGRNFEEYRGFVVYVVDAEAVIYKGAEAEEPVKLCEIDILSPYRFVEERVRTYGEILEVKAALQALERRNVNLALLDGSLISSLIKPLYAERRRGLQGIDEFVKRLEAMNPWEANILSKRLWEELKETYGGEAGRASSYLEGVEKLLLYKRLLSLHRDKLIFISKTSRGIDYFSSFKPDLAIFEHASKTSGYSKPLEVMVGEKVKRRLPVDGAFFKSLRLTLFYARLEDGGPVLRFEVPRKLGEEEVENLLNHLAIYSVAGYPYPLGKAHVDVEVEGAEIEKVVKMLGVHRVEGVETYG